MYITCVAGVGRGEGKKERKKEGDREGCLSFLSPPPFQFAPATKASLHMVLLSIDLLPVKCVSHAVKPAK